MPPEVARICIITPGALGSNPRVVKEAQALSEAGYAVTVISTRTLDFVDQLDLDALSSVAWCSRRIDLRQRSAAWRLKRVLQTASAQVYAATGVESLADFSFSAFTRPLKDAVRSVAADLYIAHYPAALPAAATVRPPSAGALCL